MELRFIIINSFFFLSASYENLGYNFFFGLTVGIIKKEPPILYIQDDFGFLDESVLLISFDI